MNKPHTHVAVFGDLFFSGCLWRIASGTLGITVLAYYQEWFELRISKSEHMYASRHSE